jgi:hypothetical protein
MARASSGEPLSALVREAGVIPEGALVDAVAGEPVRGSWWGHRSSHTIFHALQRLEDDPEVFLCKLLEGKQTYVHRRLWPALLRVQSEGSLWPSLSPAARRLLTRVEREGAVQASGRPRLELEQTLRVAARSEHTPSGAHAVVLTPFQARFSKACRAAARRLRLKAAQAALGIDGGVKALGPKARVLRSSARRGRGTVRPTGRR